MSFLTYIVFQIISAICQKYLEQKIRENGLFFRLRKIEEIFLDECFSGIFVRPSDTFCLTAGV